MRAVNNAFGQADKKIEQYHTDLLRLRENFLDCGAVITEVAVLEAGECF
jgi:hypothetical protein